MSESTITGQRIILDDGTTSMVKAIILRERSATGANDTWAKISTANGSTVSVESLGKNDEWAFKSLADNMRHLAYRLHEMADEVEAMPTSAIQQNQSQG